MLSVAAVYDGKELKFNEQLNIDSPHKVIVTFLDEPEDHIDAHIIQNIAMKGGAFDFLNDHEEDIYSDDDLKVKY